jgi:hypothetical protein
VRVALWWIEHNTQPASALATSDVLRAVLDGLTVRLDGKPAAASVVSRRRKIFNTIVEYAVECGLLDSNPVRALRWQATRSVYTVDRAPWLTPRRKQWRLVTGGLHRCRVRNGRDERSA